MLDYIVKENPAKDYENYIRDQEEARDEFFHPEDYIEPKEKED